MSVPQRQASFAKAMRRAMTNLNEGFGKRFGGDCLWKERISHGRCRLAPISSIFGRIGRRLIVEVDGNQHGDERPLREMRNGPPICDRKAIVCFDFHHDVITAIDSVLDTIAARLNGPHP